MQSSQQPTPPFILDFSVPLYPYWEDVNEGILNQLPQAKPNQLVLDVGCGRAALGAAIKQKGYQVWGVEQEPAALEKAAPRIDKVIPADLHDIAAVGNALGGMLVDYVIFSDVLEHIYDPIGVLRLYLKFLKPGGKVLVSVPNIANWEARLKLLFGIFGYRDSGVMDRTHVRFFTHKTAAKMVESAGLTVVETGFTPYIARAFIPLIKRILAPGEVAAQESEQARGSMMDSPAYKFYQRLIYPIEYGLTWLLPGLFTFRIIVVGEKKAS